MLETTIPSFTIGRRFHPRYSAELRYSSYTYNEGPSETVPEIEDSNFNVQRLNLGIRFFSKNITFSIGYSYINVERELTIEDGAIISEEFYAYKKTLHGIYGTIGYQVFLLNSFDFYAEVEASSNKQYHSISGTIGFRFYPGGLFR